MSKNFELLHNLSNEKGLFETLDGGEEVSESEAGAKPNPEIDGKARAKTLQQASLPDVFRSIMETLGPLGPLTSPLEGSSEPGAKDWRETPDSALQERFPISRNPLTRMGVAPALPAWDGPKIEPENGLDLGSEVEVEWEPGLGQNSVFTDAPSEEKTTSFSRTAIEEPPPFKEESPHPEPPRSAKTSPSGPRTNRGVEESEPVGRSRSKPVQPRGVYKDAKREQIAREEECKLVQRVFLGEENSTRVALFAGLEHDGGCASICVRAAETLAAHGEGSVCLVDADFQTPSLHEYFDEPNGKGLAEATQESRPIQEFARQLAPSNLWLVPCGYGASALHSAKSADQLRARMEELRNAYRYVVVHSGPLGLHANAMLLSKWIDGVVLILEANATRRETARRIKERLAVANAKVLGIVLNNRSYPIPEALYTRL